LYSKIAQKYEEGLENDIMEIAASGEADRL
jgi:hypothetical protein